MKKFNNNRQGFTLTELIISMVIALLILIIVSSTFVLNQRVYRKSNTKAELIQNARITLDLMSREIRQATSVVTTLPDDNSIPATVAHELEFQDGHVENTIQYIRYYLSGSDLNRQIVVYYFDTDPSTYVTWDDINAFGPPTLRLIEDKTVGENFGALDFYGNGNINIDLTLTKNNEIFQMKSIINPRNN
ncbi:MAG: prepilin-type N-terminal cleavage/methylation domain-containing protein [Patescibacteria group bacterium]|nr:prepilin-type N-terminal cleavage/methylation domain-containing protein [Patescibacteria group bacterium]